MNDPKHIYLEPTCCADADLGRLWYEDPDPVDCENGKAWTCYTRGDLLDEANKNMELYERRYYMEKQKIENIQNILLCIKMPHFRPATVLEVLDKIDKVVNPDG